MAISQYAIFSWLLLRHFNAEATVALTPSEIRVCARDDRSVVFTCSTTDPVLTWEVGVFSYQFPDVNTGNTSTRLGQFLLEVESNGSSTITSTATAENVSALTIDEVSCFGSRNEDQIERGRIVPRDPPPSVNQDLVNISVNSNNTVTTTWSNTDFISDFCLDFYEVNITTCSSDTVIISLRAGSNTTTITHPLPDDLPPLDGICATVTPVDDRGRTPTVTNSTTNKTCSCPTAASPSSTPYNDGGDSSNLPMILIIALSCAGVLLVVIFSAFVVAVIVLPLVYRKKHSKALTINNFEMKKNDPKDNLYQELSIKNEVVAEKDSTDNKKEADEDEVKKCDDELRALDPKTDKEKYLAKMKQLQILLQDQDKKQE